MRTFTPLLAAAALVAPAAAHAQDAARAPVQALCDGLIATMKTGGGQAARAARIGPVIDRTFDIPAMTRISVGPSWTTTPAADQQALVAAFRRLTVANYASNFNGWSGQSFAIDPNVEERGGDKLVRTTLKGAHGDSTAISYRLRQSSGGWRIVDVFYKNSISQIATRRADFASVLASGGPKALISHLNALSAKAGG